MGRLGESDDIGWLDDNGVVASVVLLDGDRRGDTGGPSWGSSTDCH